MAFNAWNCLSNEWQALPDIARRVRLTESETTVFLEKFLRKKMAERMLGEVGGRPSTWYRRIHRE